MGYEYIDASNYVYSEKEEILFENITKLYLKFLKSDKYFKKNSYVQWNLAGRGWGKTALAFIIIAITLDDNSKRFVQLYKAPKHLLENINEVIQHYNPNFIGRFEIIDKIRQIKNNSIFIIDEGLIGANAKEALTIAMRNLGKFLSKSRHPNVIVLINSVNLNILSEFRDMIDILVYKHVGTSFINNNKNRDSFLEEHKDILTDLKEWEGILISDYKLFEQSGKISLKLKDYCPWFSDELSRYHSKTSADVNFDEAKEKTKIFEKIAKEIIHEVGDEFLGKDGKDNFISWVNLNRSENAYDYKTELGKLYKFYKYFLHYPDGLESDYIPKPKVEFDFKPQEYFPEFCRRTLLKINTHEYSKDEIDKISRIAEGITRGDSYETINDNNKDIEYHFVQKTAEWIRSEANYMFGLGYLFEKWFAYNLGIPKDQIETLVGGSNKQKPDLVWKNIIYSIKTRFNKKNNQLKYSQSIDFSPEYNLAKKKGCTYFLIFYNPKWTDKVITKEIDPFKDPDVIIVKKPRKQDKKLVF